MELDAPVVEEKAIVFEADGLRWYSPHVQMTYAADGSVEMKPVVPFTVVH